MAFPRRAIITRVGPLWNSQARAFHTLVQETPRHWSQHRIAPHHPSLLQGACHDDEPGHAVRRSSLCLFIQPTCVISWSLEKNSYSNCLVIEGTDATFTENLNRGSVGSILLIKVFKILRKSVESLLENKATLAYLLIVYCSIRIDYQLYVLLPSFQVYSSTLLN